MFDKRFSQNEDYGMHG